MPLWNRIAERPLAAKMMAGILLAGIFSLMASPDILSHGKASGASFAKSASSQMGSMAVPRTDCSSDRHQPSDTLP
ncbi:MAG TPA: hypothetical protein VJV04_08300 [Nitrospiraceae bacterium]|nr:hypothetical protein [Nitrospiraceae bacterium]